MVSKAGDAGLDAGTDRMEWGGKMAVNIYTYFMYSSIIF